MKISGRFKPGELKSWQGFRPLFKKSLASIAAVALVCSAIPLMSWADFGDTFTQGDLTYTILTEVGDNFETGTVSVKATNNLIRGDITIAETVADPQRKSFKYKVTTIEERAFSKCHSLTSINIPNSVTTIGDWAFDTCGNLTSINIPDSVTTIGYGAFYSCSRLPSVTIPNSVTSIGNVAFSYSGLTKITIPDSVTSIGYKAFEGCLSLTSVIIGNSVTSIGYEAFLKCKQLKFMKIPDSVTSIGSEAFQDCWILARIQISMEFNLNLFYGSGIILDENDGNKYRTTGGLSTYVNKGQGRFEDDDISSWGDPTVTETGTLCYFNTTTGTNGVEIWGKSIIWLKDTSYEDAAWYGIDNSSGLFELGSRFWVRWLNKETNAEEWQKYYDQMNADQKIKADKNLWIFLVGVTKSNGEEYTDLGRDGIPLYIQVSQDWPKNKIKSTFIADGTNEEGQIEFIDNQKYDNGSGEFAKLTLKSFSPYCPGKETCRGIK